MKLLTKYLELMRIHQWLKNLLFLVPLFTSSKVFYFRELLIGFIGIVGFSLICSANYIINDINDIHSDKRSTYKKNRPIASGEISTKNGLKVSILLSFIGLLLCFKVSLIFFFFVLLYLSLALTYTFKLKKQPTLQIVVLVAFYEFRILAGGVLFGISISFWLMLFSFTIFSSLACLKMYAKIIQDLQVTDRIMRKKESELMSAIGSGFGIASVLTFALYINSPEVSYVYSSPKILWIMVPLLQFLIIHLWRETFTKGMHYDPIIFILRDLPSQMAMLGICSVLVIGRILV